MTGEYDEVNANDTVVLGDEVKVVFTSASSVLDIHIEDCFAHNDKYLKVGDEYVKDANGALTKEPGFNELQLVEDDCLESGDKLDIIKR